MSDSFGYLTIKGYCAGGNCLKWPVLLGEFSAPHGGAAGDYPTMDGLVNYINNAGDAKDGRHTAITNWFFCECQQQLQQQQQLQLPVRHTVSWTGCPEAQPEMLIQQPTLMHRMG